jgi:hypothetical protein
LAVCEVRILTKIIICFQENGCMSTNLEFKWIGYVKRTYFKDNCKILFYNVQPLIKGSSENRNRKENN